MTSAADLWRDRADSWWDRSGKYVAARLFPESKVAAGVRAAQLDELRVELKALRGLLDAVVAVRSASDFLVYQKAVQDAVRQGRPLTSLALESKARALLNAVDAAARPRRNPVLESIDAALARPSQAEQFLGKLDTAARRRRRP